MLPRSLEIVQALRCVNIVQSLDCFDLDDDSFINQEIGDKIPDEEVPVSDFDPLLLDNAKPGLLKFDRKGVFIHLFKKPGAQDITYLVDTADNFLCDLIQL